MRKEVGVASSGLLSFDTTFADPVRAAVFLTREERFRKALTVCGVSAIHVEAGLGPICGRIGVLKPKSGWKASAMCVRIAVVHRCGSITNTDSKFQINVLSLLQQQGVYLNF